MLAPNAHVRPKRQTAACGVATTLTAAQQTESINIHNYWRALEPAANMIGLVRVTSLLSLIIFMQRFNLNLNVLGHMLT